MKIDEASVEQLKAAAYDQLAAIEQAQNTLKAINGEMLKRQSKSVEKDKTEEKK